MANVAGLIVVWCTLCVPQHGNVAVAAPPSTSNRIDRLILIGVGPVYICNMMQLEGRFYCIQQNFVSWNVFSEINISYIIFINEEIDVEQII